MDQANSYMRKGNVLVYHHSQKIHSRLIALLTKSEYSHAALLYDDREIIDLNLDDKGIIVYPFSLDEKDPHEGVSQVRVFEHTNMLNPDQVISATKKYLDANFSFNSFGLVLLAGLLVYRYLPIFPDSLFYILKQACYVLDDIIENWKKNPTKSMVCSQFAYQCFWDASLKLDIDGILKKDGFTDRGICLFDGLLSLEESDDGIPKHSTIDEGLENLYTILASSETNKAISKLPKGAKDIVSEFDKRVRMLTKITAMPMETFFITPADIANAKNLKRKKEDWTKIYW